MESGGAEEDLPKDPSTVRITLIMHPTSKENKEKRDTHQSVTLHQQNVNCSHQRKYHDALYAIATRSPHGGRLGFWSRFNGEIRGDEGE